jgi:hypothetical protein
MTSPDEICSSNADRGVKFTSRLMDEGYLLLEGDSEALRFLGDLLIAQADFTPDCGFQISPENPGSALFNEGSTTGLYIHRLPCLDEDHG